ncbi:MAG: hypothetical protein M1833_000949 [Piccolia ochrophora]|nr:MAG: hypothetical protein M1833_000949 [Piccolia ochrophora]
MAEDSDGTHVDELVAKALHHSDQGQTEAASRALREAISIAPENSKVKAAFAQVQQEDEIHPLLKACRLFATHQDDDAGRDAVQYLRRGVGELPRDVGKQCTALLLQHSGTALTDDQLLAGLLQRSLASRELLASHIDEATTEFFTKIWDLGDGSVNGLVTVTLDPSAWTTQEAREQAERNIFTLLLAKLIEAGQEYQTRAMKGLARLLAVDAERLQTLIDSESLEIILSCLDMEKSTELRSQATLAAAKYLEASQEPGARLLSKFIATRVAEGGRDGLVVAFSAAAALFPIVPSTLASLFLTQGFVESLVQLAEKTTSVSRVRQSILEMLSAACMNKGCREAIRKHCSGLLEGEVANGNDHNSETATVVLAKIRGANDAAEPGQAQRLQDEGTDAEGLVSRFKTMLVTDREESRQSSIEGLAYATLQPKVKEQIAKDKDFLKDLVNRLTKSSNKPTVIFGGLTILANITAYQPTLSEEQKRLAQLKAYANTSKAKVESDPLDDDAHVTSRCTAILDAQTVPLLVHSSKTVSPSALTLILNILLSLSKTPKHRGPIAQQGGVKLLCHSHAFLAENSPPDVPNPSPPLRTAAHALARILISVNPSLIFASSSLPIASAIRPLLSLLSEDDPSTSSSGPRDLLPTFESLLALTNLASADDPTRDLITRLAAARIEDLLLSRNALLQRAAVELECNLVASPTGVARFADGSLPAATRLHILLALTDVDDLATRRAAGGALAMLTEWDAVVEAVVARDRGVILLLGLCAEDEDELRHRGAVCVRNLVSAPGAAGRKGVQAVRRDGGKKAVTEMLRATRNSEVLELGVEVLKALEG